MTLEQGGDDGGDGAALEVQSADDLVKEGERELLAEQVSEQLAAAVLAEEQGV